MLFEQILYFVEARCASEVLVFAAMRSIVVAPFGRMRIPHYYEATESDNVKLMPVDCIKCKCVSVKINGTFCVGVYPCTVIPFLN